MLTGFDLQLLVHPSILQVALDATKTLGWSAGEQQRRIVLAVRDDEAGPARATHKTLDWLLSSTAMQPVSIKEHKSRVAYLGYSSGTSGKAKGVRTSHYNMTVRPAFFDAGRASMTEVD